MPDFKIIKVTIGRSFADAYAFLSDLRNLALWGGIDPGTEIKALEDGAWGVQIDGASLSLRTTASNGYGVLDVDTTLPGTAGVFRNFARLTPNQDGCDYVFCHIAAPGISAEQFDSQNAWIEADLLRLKSYLEGDLPTPNMLKSSVISVAIKRPVDQVLPYLIEPIPFMRWAAITSNRMVHQGGLDWLFDTAAGPRIVRFHAPNSFGIADQAVFAEGETPLVNPMRVLPSAEGSIVTYVCFQRPGTSEEKYLSTLEWITSDFLTLQSVAEI
ncbi:hypothetical protein [Devosia sp.]|uniref:hypothetical protein n=1 Tax=Devosia sp. TaxID=1871048 RepID=UPI003BAC3D1A